MSRYLKQFQFIFSPILVVGSITFNHKQLRAFYRFQKEFSQLFRHNELVKHKTWNFLHVRGFNQMKVMNEDYGTCFEKKPRRLKNVSDPNPSSEHKNRKSSRFLWRNFNSRFVASSANELFWNRFN
jgi:hypothetical protein